MIQECPACFSVYTSDDGCCPDCAERAHHISVKTTMTQGEVYCELMHGHDDMTIMRAHEFAQQMGVLPQTVLFELRRHAKDGIHFSFRKRRRHEDN